MKGLLHVNSLMEKTPLVRDWLKYAEATRMIIEEHYQGCGDEERLSAAIEENVLTQIENLRSYPIVHSKLYSGQLTLHAWVYKIETGGVFVYSTERCNIQAEHEDDLYEMTTQPLM